MYLQLQLGGDSGVTQLMGDVSHTAGAHGLATNSVGYWCIHIAPRIRGEGDAFKEGGTRISPDVLTTSFTVASWRVARDITGIRQEVLVKQLLLVSIFVHIPLSFSSLPPAPLTVRASPDEDVCVGMTSNSSTACRMAGSLIPGMLRTPTSRS